MVCYPTELLPPPCRIGGVGEGGRQRERHLTAFPQTVCRVYVEKSKVNLLFKWQGLTFRSLRYVVGLNACLTFEQKHTRYCIEHTRYCVEHNIKCILYRRKG